LSKLLDQGGTNKGQKLKEIKVKIWREQNKK